LSATVSLAALSCMAPPHSCGSNGSRSSSSRRPAMNAQGLANILSFAVSASSQNGTARSQEHLREKEMSSKTRLSTSDTTYVVAQSVAQFLSVRLQSRETGWGDDPNPQATRDCQRGGGGHGDGVARAAGHLVLWLQKEPEMCNTLQIPHVRIPPPPRPAPLVIRLG